MVARRHRRVVSRAMARLRRWTLEWTAGAPPTPAEEARRDSLAAYSRALYKAQREGKAPPPPPPVVPRPADADTARTKAPPPAPADTSSTPVIGPSR